MRKFGWVAALVAGLVIGGAVSATALGALPVPFLKEPSTPGLEQLPTQALASVLMLRVTNTFIADSRASWPAAGGVTFYDQPTPFGDFFCMVRTYSVPHTVVNHESEERHLEPLKTGEALGLWIDPIEAKAMDRTSLLRARERACREYRDFKNLVAERDPMAASGGIEFLAAVRAAIREDRLGARMSCSSQREEHSDRPCDALAYLRTIDLKSVRYAETLENHLGEDRVPWRATYRLTISDAPVDGHPAGTTITIAGRHSPGMEVHSIASVEIDRQVF